MSYIYRVHLYTTPLVKTIVTTVLLWNDLLIIGYSKHPNRSRVEYKYEYRHSTDEIDQRTSVVLKRRICSMK